MSKRIYRILQRLLLLLTLSVLTVSFYLQYSEGLKPCPLCLMQRLCVFLLLASCLMGLYLSSLKRGRIVAVFQLLFAGSGLFFAIRQLWLQSLPVGQVPACLPGLDVLIQYFPWQDVARSLLWGSGECAEVVWQWLGLTMPAWAAVYFIIMLIAGAVSFWRLGDSLQRSKWN